MADNKNNIPPEKVDALYRKLNEEAQASGYNLNPDTAFTRELVESLIVNQARYGYPACPCRLAAGVKEKDLDIICPCDYRDPDIDEHGTCYCGLYVSRAVVQGAKTAGRIPERRLPETERARMARPRTGNGRPALPYLVWRCKVCGYLCARAKPPEVCPICKASKERFEVFLS
ncbi:ferredoxin:glutaredoxin reductase [candidate division WOR-3 bacterium]|nr:ferredoxin:glutaredoxin reductase [candidate division WOR-3 bacterium]